MVASSLIISRLIFGGFIFDRLIFGDARMPDTPIRWPFEWPAPYSALGPRRFGLFA